MKSEDSFDDPPVDGLVPVDHGAQLVLDVVEMDDIGLKVIENPSDTTSYLPIVDDPEGRFEIPPDAG